MLGVFSFIEFGALIIFGVAGIVLGIIALIQLGKAGDRPRGHALAWSGIALSAASLAIALVLYLRVFG